MSTPSTPTEIRMKSEGWFIRREDGQFYCLTQLKAEFTKEPEESIIDWTVDVRRAVMFPTPPPAMTMKLIAKHSGSPVRLVPVSVKVEYQIHA